KKMTSGVGMLFKGNKVTLLTGTAAFVDAHTISVGAETHTAKSFIVATGSSPVNIPGFDLDGDRVVDSTGALVIGDSVPQRLLVIGGGVIGLEFADVYQSLGSTVTVVEMLDQIAPSSDADAAKELRKALEKRGIVIKTGTKVASQKPGKRGTDVELTGPDGTEKLVVDRILVAVGRRPNG